jgi:methylene-fatty-acyl-phospholipid synthase
MFWTAAALLLVERASYVWIARSPDHFRTWSAKMPGTLGEDPVLAVECLFCAFKVIQIGVFAWWCYTFGGIVDEHGAGTALGVAAIAAGQALNAIVFYRLGREGVFYGGEFGRAVPWFTSFPFSLFRHPQYVGTVLSIWGAFLLVRFPAGDWWLLPALETIYYAVGARLERGPMSAQEA